ncbi:Uncharacterised protein [uncultured archaeon]|nr:Uncharacterised protein [uncultured archaeon]
MLKTIYESFIIVIFIIFILISFNWIKTNGFNDPISITALATVIYAIFTFFMFWNMKTNAENQFKPILKVSFNDNLHLNLTNLTKNNPVANLKIRARGIYPVRIEGNNKFSVLMSKIFTRAWNVIPDYPFSLKKDIEFMEHGYSFDLSEIRNENIEKKVKKLYYSKKIKDMNYVFKILLFLSYESISEIKYELRKNYIVRVENNKINIAEI